MENECCRYTVAFFCHLLLFRTFLLILLLLNVPSLVNHSSANRLYPFVINSNAKSWQFFFFALVIVCCSFATSKWICFRCLFVSFCLLKICDVLEALKRGIISRVRKREKQTDSDRSKYCIVNALNKRSNKNEHYLHKSTTRARETLVKYQQSKHCNAKRRW